MKTTQKHEKGVCIQGTGTGPEPREVLGVGWDRWEPVRRVRLGLGSGMLPKMSGFYLHQRGAIHGS